MTYETMVKENDLLIKKIAHKYSVNGYAYEDRYQECLTKLFEVYKNYNNKYSITTYITTICKNHLLDLNKYNNVTIRSNYINGKRVSNIVNYNLLNNIINNNIYIYSEYEEEILDLCFEELNTLSPKFQEMINLILSGVTNEEVGELFGVSKQRVNKIYRDYIKNIQNLVVKQRVTTYNNSEGVKQ